MDKDQLWFDHDVYDGCTTIVLDRSFTTSNYGITISGSSFSSNIILDQRALNRLRATLNNLKE